MKFLLESVAGSSWKCSPSNFKTRNEQLRIVKAMRRWNFRVQGRQRDTIALKIIDKKN